MADDAYQENASSSWRWTALYCLRSLTNTVEFLVFLGQDKISSSVGQSSAARWHLTAWSTRPCPASNFLSGNLCTMKSSSYPSLTRMTRQIFWMLSICDGEKDQKCSRSGIDKISSSLHATCIANTTTTLSTLSVPSALVVDTVCQLNG